eukprot:g82711.t1
MQSTITSTTAATASTFTPPPLTTTATTEYERVEETLKAFDGLEERVPAKLHDEAPPERVYSLGGVLSRKSSCLVSLFIILAHALFLWGQIEPLWSLGYCYGVNATITPEGSLWEVLGCNTTDSVVVQQRVIIENFTYYSSIQGLWIEPMVVTRFSAVVLFLFSAIWPHLKLFLLHLYYYLPVADLRRRAALYWLSACGYLSLADLIVSCFLFVILNPELKFDLGVIWNTVAPEVEKVILQFVNVSKLSQQAPAALVNALATGLDKLANAIFVNNDTALWDPLLAEACGKVYNMTCPVIYYPPKHFPLGIPQLLENCIRQRKPCNRCECVVNNLLYKNEDIPPAANDKVAAVLLAKAPVLAQKLSLQNISATDVEGEAYVSLDVTGYIALVAFAVAVFTSFSASIVVDEMEEQYVARQAGISDLQSALQQNQVADSMSRLLWFKAESWGCKIWLLVATVAMVCLVIAGIFTPVFMWEIAGVIPELLTLQSEPTTTYLSLAHFVKQVGNAGGGSAYLKVFMVLFGITVLGAPLLRGLCLAILGLFPLSPVWQFILAKTSNVLGAFLGWEPLFIFLVLIMIELPGLTSTIVKPSQCTIVKPSQCQQLLNSWPVEHLLSLLDLPAPDASSCFIMYFKLLPTFTLPGTSRAGLGGPHRAGLEQDSSEAEALCTKSGFWRTILWLSGMLCMLRVLTVLGSPPPPSVDHLRVWTAAGGPTYAMPSGIYSYRRPGLIKFKFFTQAGHGPAARPQAAQGRFNFTSKMITQSEALAPVESDGHTAARVTSGVSVIVQLDFNFNGAADHKLFPTRGRLWSEP